MAPLVKPGPWISAGKLERAAYCPASAHLPRDEEPPGEAAEWGKVIHEWKETGKWPENTQFRKSTLVRRETALKDNGLTREELWPEEVGIHELRLAMSKSNIDWDQVARSADKDSDREAWKAQYDDRWAVGVCDWFATLDGQPWIDDLKTGKEVPDEPLTLPQLKMYSAWGAIYYDTTCLVSLTHWPRSPADGPPVRIWSREGMTVKAARKFQAKLERIRLRVIESRDEKLNTVPGPHCKWCPSFNYCPEYNSEK